MYAQGPSYVYYTNEPSGKRRIAGLFSCFFVCLLGAIASSICWIVYEVKVANDLQELRTI